MSYSIDWAGVDLDGTTTVTDGTNDLKVSILTLNNVDGQSWVVGSVDGDDEAVVSQNVFEPAILTMDFEREITDLTFELYDVDSGNIWDDKVTIIALDAEGNQLDVAFSDLIASHDVTGNTIEGDGAENIGIDGPGAPDSVTVSIAGPITSLTIIHDDGDSLDKAGTVGLGDFTFHAAPGPDGIVTGTDGSDLITPGTYVDEDGDEVDNQDAIIPGDGPDDDRIIARDGDDTVDGGKGSDTIDGGPGDDVITAGAIGRPDLGYPGLFPADLDPEDDRDLVDGGAGDDVIEGGDDDDTLLGGTGNDTIRGGFDRDEIDGGAGADEIVGGEGSDTITGGAGDDTIYGGIGAPTDVLNVPDSDQEPTPAPDLVPDNGRDVIDGGAGDDLIFGEDDDDTITGGAGNDTIDAGIDDDLVDGGAGDDSLIGGQGNDTILGGSGDDTIVGGRYADELSGGDDADTFVVTGAEEGDGDIVSGGSGGDDNDGFDLTALGERFVDWDLDNVTTDSDGNGIDGDLVFLDGTGAESGRLSFTNIEIICFTPGTRIATPKGPRTVEDLTAGDRVLTRDNGVQEIAWYGQTALKAADIRARPHLAPVLIRAGALGGGLPERDMMVSPQHRVLVCSQKAALYTGEREVLVAARHLVNGRDIVRAAMPAVTYVHFMCERHEVVLSDGAWTESFQPGDYSLAGIGDAQRDEIIELFPELATEGGLKDYTAARRTLKRHEAMLVAR